MQTLIDAMQAAELAGVRAYARALLASVQLDDPAVVAVVIACKARSLELELQDDSGHAVGGYEL